MLNERVIENDPYLCSLSCELPVNSPLFLDTISKSVVYELSSLKNLTNYTQSNSVFMRYLTDVFAN